MELYILKIGTSYICSSVVRLGVPRISANLSDAMTFSYCDAIGMMERLCFEAEMIRI